MSNYSQIEQEIRQQLADNTVVLYMKGMPKQPQCGFSARAVQLLEACGIDFFYVDILQRLDIRQTLPKIMKWPTFPQLYVHGELIGGSDIIIELYKDNKLQQLLHAENCQQVQALLG